MSALGINTDQLRSISGTGGKQPDSVSYSPFVDPQTGRAIAFDSVSVGTVPVADQWMVAQLQRWLDTQTQVSDSVKEAISQYLVVGQVPTIELRQDVVSVLTQALAPSAITQMGLSPDHVESLSRYVTAVSQSPPDLAQVMASARDNLMATAGLSETEAKFRERAALISGHDPTVSMIVADLNRQGILKSGMSELEMATAITAYVQQNYHYVQDNASIEGRQTDYWQSVSETLVLKAGDCEDLAILTASLMMGALLQSGVSESEVSKRVTVAAGYIGDDNDNFRGHATVKFVTESGDVLALDATSGQPPFDFEVLNMSLVFEANADQFVQYGPIDELFNTALNVLGENSVMEAMDTAMAKLKTLLSEPITVPIAAADGKSFTYYDPVTKTMKPLNESDFSRDDSPFKFFTMEKETIKPNDTVSWNLWVAKIRSEDFYTLLTDSRKYLNQMVMLYHVANSYQQYNYNFAIEIGVSYAEDSQKGELIDSIRSADRYRNKVTSGVNNFLQKISSSVEETVGQVFNFVNSTNQAQRARVEAEIQKYGRQNLAEGIFSGIADELTGAFGLARAQATMKLSSLMAKVDLYNAKQYALYMQEFSGNVQLWRDGEAGTYYKDRYFSEETVAGLNKKGRTIDLAIEKIYAKDGTSGQLKALDGKLGSLTPDLSASLDIAAKDRNAAKLSDAFILGKSGDVGQYAEFSYNFVLRLRDAMLDYQNAIRTAYMITESMISAKRQVADDVASSNENQAASAKNSMSAQAKGAVQGALGAELSRQYNALSQVEFGTRNLVNSANAYINARYNLESAYRDLANKVYSVLEMAVVAASFGLSKVARATVTAGLAAPFALVGDTTSPVLYGILIEDYVNSVLPNIPAAGLQLTKEGIFYAVEQAKHEINTNVLVQEGTVFGESDQVDRYGAIADDKNEYDSIFSDDASTFFFNRLEQIRLRALNYYADLGSDNQVKGRITANSITGTDYSLYGNTRTNKFLAERGDGGVVVKGGLMASYELDLATDFFKLNLYMIIAKAYQDTMESVVANMFGKSKSGTISNFDTNFDAYFSKESSKVDAFRYEINERANVINTQQAKYKKLKDQQKNLAFAGTRMGLQSIRALTLGLLSIPVPHGGAPATTAYVTVDAAFKLANTALDIADATYRYKFGNFAPMGANFDKKDDSLTPEFEARISDTDADQYTLKPDGTEVGNSTEEVLAVMHPNYEQDPYFTKKSQAGLDEYVANAAVYHRLDAMENAALQRIKDPSSLITEAYDGDFGRFAQVNYELLTEVYQELTRINQARTFVLMIQQAIYQTKQNMVRHMFGSNAVQSYGGMAALASAIDRYSSAVVGSYGGATGIVNDFLNEATGRVGAINMRDQAEIAMAMDISGKSVIGAMDAVALVRAASLSPNALTSDSQKEMYERLVMAQTAVNIGIAAAKVGLGAWMMTNVNANKPRITSQMLDFSEDTETQYQGVRYDKTDGKAKTKDKRAESDQSIEGEGSAVDTGPAVNEKSANSEFGKSDYGIYSANSESSGGFKSRVNASYQSRAETAVNRRDRQMRLLREISLSMSDARQDAAAAFTGNEAAKNAYRLINTILRQQTNLELASIGMIFSAIRAAVDSANRGLEMTMEGVMGIVSSAVQMASYYMSSQNKSDQGKLKEKTDAGVQTSGAVSGKKPDQSKNKKSETDTDTPSSNTDQQTTRAGLDEAETGEFTDISKASTPGEESQPQKSPVVKSEVKAPGDGIDTSAGQKRNELKSTVEDRVKRREAWSEALQILGPLLATMLAEGFLNDFDASAMLQNQQDTYGLSSDDYFDGEDAGEFHQDGSDSGAEKTDGMGSNFGFLSTSQLETATLANTVLSNGYAVARENYQDRAQAYGMVASQWANWGKNKAKGVIQRTADRVRDYYTGQEMFKMAFTMNEKELGELVRKQMTDSGSMDRKLYAAITGDPRSRAISQLMVSVVESIKSEVDLKDKDYDVLLKQKISNLTDDAVGKIAMNTLNTKIKAKSLAVELDKMSKSDKVTGIQLVEFRQNLQALKFALAKIDPTEAESIPDNASEDARVIADNIRNTRSDLKLLAEEGEMILLAGIGDAESISKLMGKGFTKEEIKVLYGRNGVFHTAGFQMIQAGIDPTRNGLLERNSGYRKAFLELTLDQRVEKLKQLLGVGDDNTQKLKIIQILARNADAQNFGSSLEAKGQDFLTRMNAVLVKSAPPLTPVLEPEIHTASPLTSTETGEQTPQPEHTTETHQNTSQIQQSGHQTQLQQNVKQEQDAHNESIQRLEKANDKVEAAIKTKLATDAEVDHLAGILATVEPEASVTDLSGLEQEIDAVKQKVSGLSKEKNQTLQKIQQLESQKREIQNRLEQRKVERETVQIELDGIARELEKLEPVEAPPQVQPKPNDTIINLQVNHPIDPIQQPIKLPELSVKPEDLARLERIRELYSMADSKTIPNANKNDLRPLSILQVLQLSVGKMSLERHLLLPTLAITFSNNKNDGRNVFDQAINRDANKILKLFKTAKLGEVEQGEFETLESRSATLSPAERKRYTELTHRRDLHQIYNQIENDSKNLTPDELIQLDGLQDLEGRKVKLSEKQQKKLTELKNRNKLSLDFKDETILVSKLIEKLGIERTSGLKAVIDRDAPSGALMLQDLVLDAANLGDPESFLREAGSTHSGQTASKNSSTLLETLGINPEKFIKAKKLAIKRELDALDPATKANIMIQRKVNTEKLDPEVLDLEKLDKELTRAHRSIATFFEMEKKSFPAESQTAAFGQLPYNQQIKRLAEFNESINQKILEVKSLPQFKGKQEKELSLEVAKLNLKIAEYNKAALEEQVALAKKYPKLLNDSGVVDLQKVAAHNVRVESQEKVYSEYQSKIQSFRSKYPQFNTVSDNELANNVDRHNFSINQRVQALTNRRNAINQIELNLTQLDEDDNRQLSNIDQELSSSDPDRIDQEINNANDSLADLESSLRRAQDENKRKMIRNVAQSVLKAGYETSLERAKARQAMALADLDSELLRRKDAQDLVLQTQNALDIAQNKANAVARSTALRDVATHSAADFIRAGVKQYLNAEFQSQPVGGLPPISNGQSEETENGDQVALSGGLPPVSLRSFTPTRLDSIPEETQADIDDEVDVPSPTGETPQPPLPTAPPLIQPNLGDPPQVPVLAPGMQQVIQQQMALSSAVAAAFALTQPLVARAVELRQRQMGATLQDPNLSLNQTSKLVTVLNNVLGQKVAFLGKPNTEWRGVQHAISRPFAALGLINKGAMDRLDDRDDRRVLDTDQIKKLLLNPEKKTHLLRALKGAGLIQNATEAEAQPILDVITGKSNQNRIQTLKDQLSKTDLVPAEMISDIQAFADQHKLNPENKDDINPISFWVSTLNQANQARKDAQRSTLLDLVSRFEDQSYYGGQLNEPGLWRDKTLGLNTAYQALYRLPVFTGAREYREGRDAARQAQRLGQDRTAGTQAFSDFVDEVLHETADSRDVAKELKSYEMAIKQVAAFDSALADTSNRTRMSPGLFEPGYIPIRDNTGKEKMVRASDLRAFRDRAIEMVYDLESTRAQKIADMIDEGKFGEAKDSLQLILDKPNGDAFAAAVLLRIQHADARYTTGSNKLDRMGEFVSYINKISKSKSPDRSMAAFDDFKAKFAAAAFSPITKVAAATIQPEFSNQGLSSTNEQADLQSLTNLLIKPLDYMAGVGSYLLTLNDRGIASGRGVALTQGEAAGKYKYSLSDQGFFDGKIAFLREQFGANIDKIEKNVVEPLRNQLKQSDATPSLLEWADNKTLDALIESLPNDQNKILEMVGLVSKDSKSRANVYQIEVDVAQKSQIKSRVESAIHRVTGKRSVHQPEERVRFDNLKIELAKQAELAKNSDFGMTNIKPVDDFFEPSKSTNQTTLGVNALRHIRNMLDDPDHATEAVSKLNQSTTQFSTMVIQLASAGNTSVNHDIVSTLAKLQSEGGAIIADRVATAIASASKAGVMGIGAFREFVTTESQQFLSTDNTQKIGATRGSDDIKLAKAHALLQKKFAESDQPDYKPDSIGRLENRINAQHVLAEFSTAIRQASAQEINQFLESDQAIQNYVATMQLAGNYVSLADLANAASNRVIKPAEGNNPMVTVYTPLFNRIGREIARLSERLGQVGDRVFDIQSIIDSVETQASKTDLQKAMGHDLRDGATQQFAMSRSTDLLHLTRKSRETAVVNMLDQANDQQDGVRKPTISAVQALVVDLFKQSPNGAAVLIADTVRVNPNHGNTLLDGMRRYIGAPNGISNVEAERLLTELETELGGDLSGGGIRDQFAGTVRQIRGSIVAAPTPELLSGAFSKTAEADRLVTGLRTIFSDAKARLRPDDADEHNQIDIMAEVSNQVLTNPTSDAIETYIQTLNSISAGSRVTLSNHAFRSIGTWLLSHEPSTTQTHQALIAVEQQFWRDQVRVTGDQSIGSAILNDPELMTRLAKGVTHSTDPQPDLELITTIATAVATQASLDLNAPHIQAFRSAARTVLAGIPLADRFSSQLGIALFKNAAVAEDFFNPKDTEPDHIQYAQYCATRELLYQDLPPQNATTPVESFVQRHVAISGKLAILNDPRYTAMAREFMQDDRRFNDLMGALPHQEQGASDPITELNALRKRVQLEMVRDELKSGKIPPNTTVDQLVEVFSIKNHSADALVTTLRQYPAQYLALLDQLKSQALDDFTPVLKEDLEILKALPDLTNMVYIAVQHALHRPDDSQDRRELLVLIGLHAQANLSGVLAAFNHVLGIGAFQASEVAQAVSQLRVDAKSGSLPSLDLVQSVNTKALTALQSVLGRCNQTLAQDLQNKSNGMGRLARQIMESQQGAKSYQSQLNILINTIGAVSLDGGDALSSRLFGTKPLAVEDDVKRLAIVFSEMRDSQIQGVQNASRFIGAALLGELLNGNAKSQFVSKSDNLELKRQRDVSQMIESADLIKGKSVTVDGVERLEQALEGMPDAATKLQFFIVKSKLIQAATDTPPAPIALETVRVLVETRPGLVAGVLSQLGAPFNKDNLSAIEIEGRLPDYLELRKVDQVALEQYQPVHVDVSISNALLATPSVSNDEVSHLSFGALKAQIDGQTKWVDTIQSERILRDRLDVLHVKASPTELRLLSQDEKTELIADWKSSLHTDPNWRNRVADSPQLLSSLSDVQLMGYIVENPTKAARYRDIIAENPDFVGMLDEASNDPSVMPALAPVVSLGWAMGKVGDWTKKDNETDPNRITAAEIDAFLSHPLLFSGPRQLPQIEQLRAKLNGINNRNHVVHAGSADPHRIEMDSVLADYETDPALLDRFDQYLNGDLQMGAPLGNAKGVPLTPEMTGPETTNASTPPLTPLLGGVAEADDAGEWVKLDDIGIEFDEEALAPAPSAPSMAQVTGVNQSSPVVMNPTDFDNLSPAMALRVLNKAATALRASRDPDQAADKLLQMQPQIHTLIWRATELKNPQALQIGLPDIDTVRSAVAQAAIRQVDLSQKVTSRAGIPVFVGAIHPQLQTVSEVWDITPADQRNAFLDKLNQSVPPEAIPKLIQSLGIDTGLASDILKTSMHDPKTGRLSEGRAAKIAKAITDDVLANKPDGFDMSDRLMEAVDAEFDRSVAFSGALAQQLYAQVLHRVGFPKAASSRPIPQPDQLFLQDADKTSHTELLQMADAKKSRQVKWTSDALVHEFRTQAAATFKSNRGGYQYENRLTGMNFDARMKTFISGYTKHSDRKQNPIGMPDGIARVVFGGVARATLAGSGGQQVRHKVSADTNNVIGSRFNRYSAQLTAFLFGFAGLNNTPDWTTDALNQIVTQTTRDEAKSRLATVLDYTAKNGINGIDNPEYDALSISIWQRWATPYTGRMIQRVKPYTGRMVQREGVQKSVLAAAIEKAPFMPTPKLFNDTFITLVNEAAKIPLSQAMPSAMRRGEGRNLFTLLGTELFKGPLKYPAGGVAAGFSAAYALVFGKPAVDTLGQDAVGLLDTTAQHGAVSLQELMTVATVPTSVLAVNLPSDKVTDPLIQFWTDNRSAIQTPGNQESPEAKVVRDTRAAMLRGSIMARMVYEAGNTHDDAYFNEKLTAIGQVSSRLFPGPDQIQLKTAKTGDRILELITTSGSDRIDTSMAPTEYLFVATRRDPDSAKKLMAAGSRNLVKAALRTANHRIGDPNAATAMELIALGILIPSLTRSPEWQVATNLMLGRPPHFDGKPNPSAEQFVRDNLPADLAAALQPGTGVSNALGDPPPVPLVTQAATISDALAAANTYLTDPPPVPIMTPESTTP